MMRHVKFVLPATVILCLGIVYIFDFNAFDVTSSAYRLLTKQYSLEEQQTADHAIEELRAMLANTNGDQRPRPVKLPPIGDIVHICIAAGNKGILEEVSVLLKSLFLLAETREVFLHLLVDDDSRAEISSFMSEYDRTFVPFRYEMKTLNKTWLLDMLEGARIRSTHHSGLFGMSKLFFYLIWEHVDRCLMIDTDLVFGTDPAFLWSEFASMKPSSLVMMQLSDISDTLACSCVMLQKFEQMRKVSFFDYVKPLVPKVCKMDNQSTYHPGQYFKCKGNQLFYHSVYLTNKELYTSMDLSWNLEYCHRFHGVDFKRSLGKSKQYFFGIAHFNCFWTDKENAFATFIETKDRRNAYLATYVHKVTRLHRNSFYSAKYRNRNATW